MENNDKIRLFYKMSGPLHWVYDGFILSIDINRETLYVARKLIEALGESADVGVNIKKDSAKLYVFHKSSSKKFSRILDPEDFVNRNLSYLDKECKDNSMLDGVTLRIREGKVFIAVNVITNYDQGDTETMEVRIDNTSQVEGIF
jgi:hypothetical protein